MSAANDWGDKIAATALAWNGHNFKPGVKERCMDWVRTVLAEAHHPYAEVVTEKAVDGHGTGLLVASSLAGRDLGHMVTRIQDLEPGDIIFWNDTYPVRGFPPGTITHVGIALNSQKFIHRNTMSAPVNVQRFTGIWATNFRCALRVKQEMEADPNVNPPAEDEPVLVRVWINQNGGTLESREGLPPGRYTIFSAGGDTSGACFLKLVEKS